MYPVGYSHRTSALHRRTSFAKSLVSVQNKPMLILCKDPRINFDNPLDDAAHHIASESFPGSVPSMPHISGPIVTLSTQVETAYSQKLEMRASRSP